MQAKSTKGCLQGWFKGWSNTQVKGGERGFPKNLWEDPEESNFTRARRQMLQVGWGPEQLSAVPSWVLKFVAEASILMGCFYLLPPGTPEALGVYATFSKQ